MFPIHLFVGYRDVFLFLFKRWRLNFELLNEKGGEPTSVKDRNPVMFTCKNNH